MSSSENHVSVFIITDNDKSSSKEKVLRCAGLFAASKGFATCGELIYAPHRKPHFYGDAGVNLSVSHSGIYWVCSFAFVPIGIDIEQKNERRLRDIAKRFFHPDEFSYLERRDFSPFFDVWTAKESYVKLTGNGIRDDFSDFSVVSDDKISGIGDFSFVYPEIDESYRMCICMQSPGEINFTRLF